MDKFNMQQAYWQVRAEKAELYSAAEREINAELGLRKLTLAAMFSGAIVGKNDNEREAQARTKFPDDYAELEAAQHDVRLRKLNFDLAALRLAEARAMLRIEELAARVQADDEMEGEDNGTF